MMHFDVIVPFGTSCMCSDILREQGLQMYSYPFDWVGGGTLETRTNILVNDFKDWLNYDDLVQIEPLDNLKTRKFKDFLNVKTCMTFRHHFSVDKNSPNFIEDYSTVKEKYTRRAERLKHQIQQSDNVLMITIETPNRYKIKHVQELLLAHNMKPTKFSPAQHIRLFADSLVDKMVAMCSKNSHITFTAKNNADWREFQKNIKQKHGMFLICSHIGNIEALAAFPDSKNVKIHAFQQISQTGIFHKFISGHSVRTNTIIHAVEDMNIGTATEMFDFLNNGDLVMMAGDRISASTPNKIIQAKILGRDCELPMGVFRFAKSMSHPVFAVALLNIAPEKYTFIVKKLDDKNVNNMAQEFAKFLEKNILIAPTQWFNFYKFFGKKHK